MTSKKSEPGTALAPSGESGFAILDDAGAGTLMIDTIKELGLSSFEMNRIKIPAGGSSAWEIQTLDGERAATEIVCTILHCKGNEKSWWMTTGEDSGGGPPDCVSHDGISGVGINRVLTEDDSEADIETHDCASCAWNQFGSSRKPGSKGKDCSDTAYLYFFEEDARLPTLLVVPPTSLKAVRTYALKLLNAGKDITSVKTKLTLGKKVAANGKGYSELQLSYVGDHLDGDAASMKSLSTDFKGLLNS